MKTFRKAGRMIVVTMIMFMLVAVVIPVGVHAASYANISSYTAPDTLVQGTPFYLKGSINSDKIIKRVEVGVVDANQNKWTDQKYDNRVVFSRSFNIARADPTIKFGKLAPGLYRYRIYAHTLDGQVHIVLNHRFTVTKKTAGASTAVTSTPSISGHNLPSDYTAGTAFTIKGTINCSNNMNRVEVGIVNANLNRWTDYKYDKNINAKSFNLADAASAVKFDKLPAGTYRYRIYVHTSNGVALVLNHRFIVSASKATATQPAGNTSGNTTAGATPAISGQNLPSDCTAGTAFSIKGNISCANNISRIEIGIVDANANRWTDQKFDRTVNTKSFNIADAASAVRFDSIPAGVYRYRIYAHTSNGVTLLLNHKFNVSAATAPETSHTGASTGSAGVKITGYNLPGTYNVGNNFTPRGTISSDQTITRVEVGIVFAPTNKWTEYKYDATVNSKSFNVANAASTLKFNKLPGGIYRYRIYAHTAKGVTIVLNHRFTVNPSNKPQLAVNWAKNIANDNSFTYGAKPDANAIGCYFCGTNCGPVRYYKPKGYEKTYVCMTFIGAAYAHGAKDPEILDKCSRGKMTMYETDDNFKVFSCWMKIGACRDLTVEDLQPGDVVIKWSDGNDNNGHVFMYVGGDTLVESTGGGWGAGSIAVKSGAASRLKELSGNRQNYVMRYTK